MKELHDTENSVALPPFNLIGREVKYSRWFLHIIELRIGCCFSNTNEPRDSSAVIRNCSLVSFTVVSYTITQKASTHAT